MRAELDSNGLLTISSETELESYALREWMRHHAEAKECDRYRFIKFDATFGKWYRDDYGGAREVDGE